MSALRGPLFPLIYFIAVLLLALAYTYPLAADLTGSFYGIPWDPLGGIWYLWWMKFSFQHGLALLKFSYNGFPAGFDATALPFPYLFNAEAFALTGLFGEVAAYNILKLLNFPLLALTSYFLIHSVTRHRIISALMGLAFAFSPFHSIHLMSHFANLYWLPLVLLFLLKLLLEGGKGNAALMGLFWGLTFIDNQYQAFFFGLLAPVSVCALLFSREGRGRLLRPKIIGELLITLTVFAAVISPMMYPVLKSGPYAAALSYSRGFSDLFVFSAKPLDYLLPSKHNMLIGRFVPDLGIGILKGHRYTEHTLYLGWTMIVLGVLLLLRLKRLEARERLIARIFVWVLFTGAILSAPPLIPLGAFKADAFTREIHAAHMLPLPQYFIFKIFPFIRVYARLGAAVLLSLIVLSSLGLKQMCGLSRTSAAKWAVIGITACLLTIEYLERPAVTRIEAPPEYAWLSRQAGDFSIAEYPFGSPDDPFTSYEYAFYQRIHNKRLVNPNMLSMPYNEYLGDITEEDAVEGLRKAGARYILVHADKYRDGNRTVPMDWLTKPPREKLFPKGYNNGQVPIISGKALRLAASFGDTSVYELGKPD